ncbi:radical SAM/SPASM domain-containing protein [Muriicola soli]|uniref:Radical SAM protein n=1 Tax=Muriicola soli TaxID=2507538 RepID=A0A411E9L7_9FLAO|nr:radical SAM protein [Muriicola soli]QBA64233.1 radical SAM protein [Muriicola soli]
MLFNRRNTEALTLSGALEPALDHDVQISEVGPKKTLPSSLISGKQKNWVHLKLKLTLIKIIIRQYNNPLDWFKGLRFLISLRRQFLGDHSLRKMAFVDGKYYMGLYTPGWNDKIYERFIATELKHFKKNKTNAFRFNHVFLAITKKCALRCEHCYEWDNLNKKEVRTKEDLQATVQKLQDFGTAQIHLTGGEPMLKLDTVISILKNAPKESNFWMNTSGLKLTDANTRKLKQAGLTGVFISLDHFKAEAHNRFRNYKDAFYWATTGAKNAINNGLVVAFSICMTRDFVKEDHIMKYMDLAKEAGVHFVQFLEPKSVGHYKNEEVALSDGQMKLLEETFLKMNFSKDYLSYPIITYHAYYQRRQGCFSGGNRGLYIDTDGDINPCTFCHRKSGNILDADIDEKLEQLMLRGCPEF